MSHSPSSNAASGFPPPPEAAPPLLVLGIGNILLSDEGAGVRAVEMLRERYALPPGVEAVDGGTMGLDLLPYLARRQLVLLVDVIRKPELPPGTVVRLELDDPPAYFRQKISPHQIGLSEVLAVAAMTGELPERLVLVGITPASLETGLGLSPEVTAGLTRLVEALAAELEQAGVALKPALLSPP